MEHFDGPVPQQYQPCLQYTEVTLTDFTVSKRQGNNCVEIQDKICLVQNVVQHKDEIYIVYTRFKTASHFFMYPLNSEDIDIHMVSNLGKNVKVAPVSAIVKKYVLLPYQNAHIAVPLIHAA